MVELPDFRLAGSAGDRRIRILPLTLQDVSYEVNGMRLIKNLTATFFPDTLSVVLGPNGAGKSLLLRLCHGLIEPTHGQIQWKERRNHIVRRFQAMVFQRPIMLRRSVFSNLEHGLRHRGVRKHERLRRIEEILDSTGLARLGRVAARRLSVGEQQRLAVARAWSLDPEVLFLDEPTAALDPAATHSLEKIIETIRKSKTKVVMTTHDLGQARRLADEIFFLYRGRLLEHSSAESFFEQPKNDLAESFLRGELLWWNRKELRPPQGSRGTRGR